MKKIFLLFIICTNLLVFFNVFEVHKEKTISDSYDLYGYKSDKYYETIIFNNKLAELNPEEFINDLNQLITHYKVMIYTNDNSYKDNYQNYYIGFNDKLNEALKLETKKDLVFNSSQTSFYSNQDQGEYFDTLNKDFKTNIYPLSQLLNIQNGYISEYTIVADNNDTLETVKNNLKNKYPSYFKEFIQYQNDILNVSQSLSEKLKLPTVFSLIISAIIILIYMEQSGKKISIMKLEGYGNVSIFMKLFFPMLFIACIGIPVFIFLFFMLFVGRVNSITQLMIIDLLKWGTFEEFILIGMFVIYFIILILTSYSTLLKGNKYIKTLLNINFIIKVCCLALVFPILNNVLNVVSENIDTLSTLNNTSSQSEDFEYTISFLKGYQFDDYDLAKYYSGQYDDGYYKYQNEYESLNKKGALYMKQKVIMVNEKMEVPLFSVNYNYFKENPLMTNDGIVEIDNNQKKIILCIPEQYKDVHIEQYIDFENNDYSIQYINNKQQFINYSIVISRRISSSLPCFLVLTDSASRIDKSPLDGVYYKGNLNNNLSINFQDKVKIESLKNNVKSLSSEILSDISSHVNIVIMIVFLLILNSIEFSHLYFETKSYNLAVKKLEGYSYIGIYKDLYIENLCVYILLSVITVFQNLSYTYLITLLFIDIFIVFICVLLFEKRNLNNVLKGGNK